MSEKLTPEQQKIWDAVERHIEAFPADGTNASGDYSHSVHVMQRAYIDGLRVGRLAAIKAIERKP